MKWSFCRLYVAPFVLLSALVFLPQIVQSPDLLGYSEGKSYEKQSDYRKKSRKERWDKFQKNRVEYLTELLALSPEQKEKVSAIIEEGRKRIEAEREKMKAIVKELKNTTDQKIEAVLNEEQKKKFRAHKEEMEQKMKERRQSRKGFRQKGGQE